MERRNCAPSSLLVGFSKNLLSLTKFMTSTLLRDTFTFNSKSESKFCEKMVSEECPLSFGKYVYFRV